MTEEPKPSKWANALVRLGLRYDSGAEPRPGGPSRSRYSRGVAVSPRLDQDIDLILERLERLERRAP